MIDVRVAGIEVCNELVRCFTLQPLQGSTLPGYTAGSHLRVQVRLADGASDWRAYSLIELDPDVDTTQTRSSYRIAVRLEQPGRGGSRFMHTLQPGELLRIEAPRNDFELQPAPGQGMLLVAGGIGVTPLTAMAARCRRAGIPVRMVYAGRSRELMAFVPELQRLLGSSLHLHVDEQAGAALDVGRVFAACAPQEQVALCGPTAMLDAARAAAEALGWSSGRLRFESFAPAAPQAQDHAFELVLAQSGRTLTVAADQTILDCLLEHGHDPLFDCRRGDCGVCAVAVLEGEIDHRDHVLGTAEKASGKVIQICISRARGQRLVLDL